MNELPPYRPDIVAGRLAPDALASNFSDIHPPLERHEAAVESDRCYFCYDAPCMQACPTGIDIRNGLQYECIACGACIDACDEVMDKMGYPRGLIRYTTENAMA